MCSFALILTLLLLGHAFLWKHGVEHSDPSLWNVMYHPIRKCGGLNGFRFVNHSVARTRSGNRSDRHYPIHGPGSSAQGILGGKSPSPLPSRTRGVHLDAALRFPRLRQRETGPENRFIKDWITSDYIACEKEKLAFITGEALRESVPSVGSAFGKYRMLMFHACVMIERQGNERRREANDNFDQLMLSEEGKNTEPAPHIEHSAAMWDAFISILSRWGLDTTRLQKHRPIFDRAQCQDLFDEIKAICNSLSLPA